MPYSIRKVRNQDCYTVKNIITGDIKAKCTTKEKARSQVFILEKIDNRNRK